MSTGEDIGCAEPRAARLLLAASVLAPEHSQICVGSLSLPIMGIPDTNPVM
jgi:hypothetical protein